MGSRRRAHVDHPQAGIAIRHVGVATGNRHALDQPGEKHFTNDQRRCRVGDIGDQQHRATAEVRVVCGGRDGVCRAVGPPPDELRAVPRRHGKCDDRQKYQKERHHVGDALLASHGHSLFAEVSLQPHRRFQQRH